MQEIRASTKVTGKRREASVAAAKRKVKDGAIYLIRRHGAYFREGAHGYTNELAAAGMFSGADARRYLEVEGLSVVPLASLRRKIAAEAQTMEGAAAALRRLEQIANHPSA